MELIYAGGHCHAPTCLAMEILNNRTGELLCRQMPVYGNASVGPQRFKEKGYVRGNQSRASPLSAHHSPPLSPPLLSSSPRLDPKCKQVALPPCLWGKKSEGLAPPPRLPMGRMLRSKKLNNATNGHYGEMASWQMRGVLLD